jgi:DNA-binding NarL/FixJ family response regulator
VVGEATDGQEAIEFCHRLQPDLVLMDVSMPGMDGLEATREIKREFPRTILLMLTAMEQPEYLAQALRAGASGYIVKDLSSQRLIDAIRRVLDGEFPINQELAAELLGQLLLDEEAPKEEAPPAEGLAPVSPSPEAHPDPSLLGSLSPRKLEVLRLVGRGHTNQQIA